MNRYMFFSFSLEISEGAKVNFTLKPGCELWWRCLGVISLLMRLAKWVQSIECGGDECLICILPFLAWWQIFLLFLGLCPMVFKNRPWPFRGRVSILGVLGYSNLLWLVVELLYSPRGFVDNTFRGLFFWYWSHLVHSCPQLFIFPQLVQLQFVQRDRLEPIKQASKIKNHPRRRKNVHGQ